MADEPTLLATVVNLQGSIGAAAFAAARTLTLATPAPAFNIQGRISAAAKASVSPPIAISSIRGTVTATSRAAAGRLGAYLQGRVSAAAKVVAAPLVTNLLRGRIGATARAAAAPLAINLILGRISASGHIRTGLLSTATITTVTLQGRISATTRARAAPFVTNLLRGTVTASARVQLDTLVLRPPYVTVVNLQGAITAGASAASGRFILNPPALTTTNLYGIIKGTARINVGVLQTVTVPLLLHGRISASGALQLNAVTEYYTSNLSGRISSRSYVRGAALPLQPVLVGHITAAGRIVLTIGEVQVPLPPYPPPFLTYTTDDYLARITSEHNQRPRYMATVGDNVDPVVQLQQLVAGIAGLFDLDYCVGEQEDFTGQWIGKSRWIEIPNPFFSWDALSFGWNQANWKGPLDSDHALQRLDDYHYRLLLYADIIANHWNGSIPAAYNAWDTLFRFTGIKVIIQDYNNMTMLYGLVSTKELDVVLLSLFTTGQMDLRPEGVQLIAYALQPIPDVPFFAWDSASDSVHGWDTGCWAILVPPGEIVIPY